MKVFLFFAIASYFFVQSGGQPTSPEKMNISYESELGTLQAESDRRGNKNKNNVKS